MLKTIKNIIFEDLKKYALRVNEFDSDIIMVKLDTDIGPVDVALQFNHGGRVLHMVAANFCDLEEGQDIKLCFYLNQMNGEDMFVKYCVNHSMNQVTIESDALMYPETCAEVTRSLLVNVGEAAENLKPKLRSMGMCLEGSKVKLTGKDIYDENHVDWSEECSIEDSFKIAIEKWRDAPKGIYEIKAVTEDFGTLFEILPWGVKVDRVVRDYIGFYDVDFSDIEFELQEAELNNGVYLPPEKIHERIMAGYNQHLECGPDDKIKDIEITNVGCEDLNNIEILCGNVLFKLVTDEVLTLPSTYEKDELINSEPEKGLGIRKRIIGDFVICYIVEDGNILVISVLKGYDGDKNKKLMLSGDNKSWPEMNEWI